MSRQGRLALTLGHRQLAALEMLDMIGLKSRRDEPFGHGLVLEAEADMGVPLAQILAVVRREIDDQQCPAGLQGARRLGNRRRRGVGVVEHLVDDDRIGDAILERQRVAFAQRVETRAAKAAAAFEERKAREDAD